MIPDGKSTTHQYVFTSAQAPDLINYLFLFNYAFVLVLDLRLFFSLFLPLSLPTNILHLWMLILKLQICVFHFDYSQRLEITKMH